MAIHAVAWGQAPLGETVTKVTFSAPAEVDREKLERFVEIRTGEPFRRRAVRRSLELLEKLGEFREVEAFARPHQGGVEVIFRLTPRPRLRHIDIRGNDNIPDRILLRQINRKAGVLMEESDADQIARAVRSEYHRQGYIRVAVRVQIVEAGKGEVDVIVEVAESKQYRLSSVRFIGDLAYTDKELVKRMKLKPGDPFNQQELDADVRRIMRYHRNNGYLEVSSRAPVPVPNDKKATVKVLIFIESGERVQIDLVGRVPRFGETVGHHLTAPVDFRPNKLNSILDLENETQFTQGFAEQGESLLRRYYQEKGYYEVEVTSALSEVDYARRLKKIRFDIEPGRRYKLKPTDIDFVGGGRLDSKEVRTEFIDGAPTVLGRNRYSDEAADAARERLEKYYRSEGFERARVSRDDRTGDPVPPEVTVDRKHRRLHLTVQLDEGPRTMVTDVRFAGNAQLSDAQLQRLVAPIGQGDEPQPLDAFLLEKKARAIEETYANRGYPDATVTVERSRARAINVNLPGAEQADTPVMLTLQIDEGPLVHFGRVITPDTALTQPDVVRDQITIRAGEVWDGRSLSQTRRKLQRLGVFDRVEVAAFSDERVEGASQSDTVQLRDVRVVLLESNRMVFEPAIGLSSEKGPRVVLRFDHRNLPPGRAHKLTLRGEANWRWEGFLDQNGLKPAGQLDTDQFEYRLLAAYTLPTLFNTNWAGSLTGVFGETDQRRTFGVRRNQAAITASRDLGKGWTLVGQYNVGFRTILDKGFTAVNDIYPSDEPAPRSLVPVRCPDGMAGGRVPCRTAEIGAEVILDRRNDRFNPSSGWLLRSDVRLADPAFGGEFSYVRVSAAATGYYPLTRSGQMNLVGSTKVGHATPFGDSAGIPVDQRFFVGGTSTLRGYTEESVGPYLSACPDGSATCDELSFVASSGGDFFWVYRLEARFPLGPVGGVLFHDGGNAWLLSSERPDYISNPFHLAASVGAGLRIATPVGPIKLDYAIPIQNLDDIEFNIDPRKIDLQGRFHITIGDF